MPAQPNDRTATGRPVAELYCRQCGFYSGGGLCRVCQRGNGDYRPPMPEPQHQPKREV